MKLIAATSLLAFCMGLMACAGSPTAPATSSADVTPGDEAVNGLKFSIAAEKTALKLTPIERDKSTPNSPEYSPEITKLTLTFTNISDKPIKLNLYDYAWSSLNFDLRFDGLPVMVDDLRALVDREMMPPAEMHYPTIEPGKSLALEAAFPGRIGGRALMLDKPGEYQLKVTYSPHQIEVAGKGPEFTRGAWSGAVTSNEIVFKCRVQAE